MGGQANKVKSSLKFIDYYVDSVEFYNNTEFDDQEKVKLDFHLEKEIKYVEDEKKTIMVTLNLKIFENPLENNYPFNMNLSLTGIFEIDFTDIDKMREFAETNAVAILFPYLRSMVSTYTANANVSPLILPPINVVSLMEQGEKHSN